MAPTRVEGGGLMARIFEFFSSNGGLVDPHPEIRVGNLEINIEHRLTELKELINIKDNNRDDFNKDRYQALEGEVESRLVSLKIKGERKKYKVWNREYERVCDLYS